MNTELKVLIEVEAVKIEVEGKKQNNYIKESVNITQNNESLFYQKCEFTEKANEIRGLIDKYGLNATE